MIKPCDMTLARGLWLFLALTLVRCASAELPTVGFIGGLSGPAKHYGEACMNGLELARQEGAARSFSVIYEDDQFLPAKTAAAFHKLVDFDRVKLVIVLSSTSANAIAPLAQKKGIPFLAWASDTNVSSKRNFIIRTWVSGEQEGKKIASVALGKGYQNTGFLIATSDYSRAVRDGFIAAYPRQSVLLNEEYPNDAQDFKPFLLKARSRHLQTLGLCVNPGQPGLIAKQAQELGIKLQFFGCENLHDREEIKISAGTLTGTWFVTGRVSPQFRHRYLARYGNDSVISGAALHYELGLLLANALPEANSPTAIIEKLLNTGEQNGAIGSFRFVRTKEDQYLDLDLMVREITATGFKDEF